MVPDIGILIAAYVFTRMVALLGTPITSKSELSEQLFLFFVGD